MDKKEEIKIRLREERADAELGYKKEPEDCSCVPQDQLDRVRLALENKIEKAKEVFEKELYDTRHIFLNTKFNSTLFGKIMDLQRDIVPREQRIKALEEWQDQIEDEIAEDVVSIIQENEKKEENDKKDMARLNALEKRLSDIEPNNANHILYEQWLDKLTGYFNRLEKLDHAFRCC